MPCSRGMQSVQQILLASSCSQFKHGREIEGQSPGDDFDAASMGFSPMAPAMGASTCHSGSCFTVCSFSQPSWFPQGSLSPIPYTHSRSMPAIYIYSLSILHIHHQKEEDGHMNWPNKGHLQMKNYWCQMNGRASNHLANWLILNVPSQINNVNVLNITEQDVGTNTSMLNSMEHENLQYCERQSLAIWKTAWKT